MRMNYLKTNSKTGILVKPLLFALALLLCLGSLSACSGVEKEGGVDRAAKVADGTTSGTTSGGTYADKGTKAASEASVEASVEKDYAYKAIGDDVYKRLDSDDGIKAVDEEWADFGEWDVNKTVKSRTLTASELWDLTHWTEFLASEKDSFGEIAKNWELSAKNRVHLTVTDANGNAAFGVKADLYLENGKCAYSAVSDMAGETYLYYNVTNPVQGNEKPARVTLTAPDGSTTEVACSAAGDYTATVSTGKSVKKLELMLMIDTTGSMSDELEYLKAELIDVVRNIEQQSGFSVTVSVNFYRDEGDDYVVRSFPFTNVSTAANTMSQQSSDGGGDYPEAVHTALADAVNGHAWSAVEDSVKVVLLVLDAPAHDEENVKSSLYASLTEAAKQGIRIVPVASSGVDLDCEYLLRTFACLTGGTYSYLTDDSGISVGGHFDPTTTVDTPVEYLNEMLVRVICRYCGTDIPVKEIEKQEKETEQGTPIGETDPVDEPTTEPESEVISLHEPDTGVRVE